MATIRSPYFSNAGALTTTCNCIVYVFICPVPVAFTENVRAGIFVFSFTVVVPAHNRSAINVC